MFLEEIERVFVSDHGVLMKEIEICIAVRERRWSVRPSI
jgi:hypothetical protein